MTNENLPTTMKAQVPTIMEYAADLDKQLAFAGMLLKTKMLPQHFTTPESVVTAILYGQEIGFSPMQALQTINVIQGKPTLSAEAIKAKILEAGGTVQTILWTESVCHLRMIRGDWVEEFTFTMVDAVKQGFAGKDNWKRMPKQMLYARCVSTLGRNMYADVLRGFYGTEEMRDSVEASVKTGDDRVVEVLPKPRPQAAISLQLETTTAIGNGTAFQYDTKRAGEQVAPDQKKIMLGRLEKQYGLVFKDGFGFTSKPIPEWSQYLMNDPSEQPVVAEPKKKPSKDKRSLQAPPIEDDIPEDWGSDEEDFEDVYLKPDRFEVAK